MHYFLTRLFCLTIAMQFMVGCSVLLPAVPNTDLASFHNQHIASAELALQRLKETDTLIKLNNRWLSNQIKRELKIQAASFGRYNFRRLKLDFGKQGVSIEALVDIGDKQGNTISASVFGNISFGFSGTQLGWLPRFSQLNISSKKFTYEGNSYTEPSEQLTIYVLQHLNTDFVEALNEHNHNTIALNAVPLGEVQVGASLPGFAKSSAQHQQPLKGVFIVAGSAMLIDSSVTSIALDLEFIPDLSTCPADVIVSRAEFANNINAREPEGIVRNMNSAADIRYFFSEISAAERPLTIIHYWFANGMPLAVEELSVGPSERWRTWSSIGSTQDPADHWKVLVVEKESGCILHSKSIRTLETETAITTVDPTQVRQAFAALHDAFNSKTVGFSITEDTPDIALIEMRRPFLAEVLQASLADLSVDAEFDNTALSSLQFSASLQPFDTGDIICEHRVCAPVPACKANLAQCKRLRDTRNCSSCLFRNPLNNRCIREAIDPLCEASRARHNAKYSADRATCIAHAETSKWECDQLNAQAAHSCQIESGFENSVCESMRNSMKSLKGGASLATVSAQTNSKGTLSVNFSNFRIETDLTRLKLDITLNADLQLDGTLSFSPSNSALPLNSCIAAWSTPFKTRFATTPTVNNLLSNFEASNNTLAAHWSGFGLTIDISPSPLESVFVNNPQLLASCKIGLTVKKVEDAFAGDDAEFFRERISLEIQPLPTIIHLAPATIESDNRVYSAEAQLTAQNLRYDIKDPKKRSPLQMFLKW